ncbi:AEC family transporter [Pseudohalocynthiibacter aestuariivivens]|jgi:malonate transporter and related proteins|uniref:AEC family transporter n=1 Tax=Pseudohalocynthiibacter aestuariivivens TaxID=1591409 RepID=A0ABV5JCT0_9RHOB|nr:MULTISPECIES: AEC family transporter [Pseudohalocynthiibacter]MBS9717236.1 AEC family transporter [Pseudohalocynthiibacter aestuariivivens]MCK0103660.1 AEC family transporter [Pseudohalocynthiibacter sp. F2068]
MQALIEVILPVFFVIGFGYLAVWRGLFSPAGVDGLMKFTQNFAIPCLLFNAISTLDLSQSFDARLLFSFYLGATSGFILGLLGARYIFNRPWEDAVAIGFCCLFSNSVLLGLPITERAYGVDALAANYAIIALHSPFCYGLGITVMEIVRNRGGGGMKTLRAVSRAMFRNALVIGIALGFVVNLSNIQMPGVFMDAISLMVRAALPAALFGLGGVLVQYRPEGDMRTIAYICVVSLFVHPAIVWTMGSGLEISQSAFRSAVLTSAMAPGINAYVFANMYGRAKRVAASAVLFATAGSVLSAWVWLTLLG